MFIWEWAFPAVPYTEVEFTRSDSFPINVLGKSSLREPPVSHKALGQEVTRYRNYSCTHSRVGTTARTHADMFLGTLVVGGILSSEVHKAKNYKLEVREIEYVRLAVETDRHTQLQSCPLMSGERSVAAAVTAPGSLIGVGGGGHL